MCYEEGMLEAKGLSKTYRVGFWGRKLRALDHLSLTVDKGEIFGLVGPNGAGKSTAIKILLGIVRPTSGSGSIDGHPIGSVASRARLGFLPENPALYEFLTGREYLQMVGSLIRLDGATTRKRTESLLDQVGLSHAGDLGIRKYSKGMVQRLGLAQALMGDPAVVILDEPMSGLDPIGRKDVRDLIFKLRDEGRTVFFSTHILPDVEMICDRVALLSKGRLTDIGRLDDLLSHRVRAVEVAVSSCPRERREQLQKTHQCRDPGDGRLLVVFEGLEEANRFAVEAVGFGAEVESLNVLRENLEELFMRRAAEVHEARQ
jgi:ABC-2 type transport system ATP-binding protein